MSAACHPGWFRQQAHVGALNMHTLVTQVLGNSHILNRCRLAVIKRAQSRGEMNLS